jgi:hypothetical protein
MKPTRSIAFTVLAGTLIIGACATKAHAEVEPGYDFATFHSYAWITPEPVLINLGDSQPTVRTGENELRIRAAVDAALVAREFAEVPYAEADLHVSFSVDAVATSKWIEKNDDPDTVIRAAVARVMAQYPASAR